MRRMRKAVATVAAIFVLLVVASSQAHALRALLATIIMGQVEVIDLAPHGGR